MPTSVNKPRFGLALILFTCVISSCSTLEPNLSRFEDYDILKPNKKLGNHRSFSPAIPFRRIASTESLITYCPKETAPAISLEEKRWRDAFSFEVMDRICNKETEIAKRRIDFQDRTKPKYLESSWVDGINLTGVQNGWPRGTAITSRHLIFTKHLNFHGQVGESISFLTMDNRLVTRKIIELKYLDNVDLAIARLESDLPGSVTPLKLLDPRAASLVPDLIPVLRIEQQSKALIVMKRSDSFSPPGEHFGSVLINPPELAYAQYYQDMIRFDSSSPSILLLRTPYGVMPILYGLVTWGGPGDGPVLHQHLAAIQTTIESFGDAHRIEKAMPPVTPFSPPSCSISARRANDGQSCDLTISASADPVIGNPNVLPYSPDSWEVQQNRWKGKVSCPTDPSTVFQATLSGPGGQGRTCESGAIGPILPQCEIFVNRRGATQVCDVRVTRIVGNPSGNPILSPGNSSIWVRSGDDWTTTTSCPLNVARTYSAQLTDEVGQGPACSTKLDVYSEIPTCEIVSQRVGFEDKCDIIVTRKSGIASENPTLNPLSSADWIREGDNYKTKTDCSAEDVFTYSARLAGPLGTGPICRSPSIMSVPAEVPFCELQATRRELTSTCDLAMNFKRGWVVSGSPVASPLNPKKWARQNNSLDYRGTTTCPLNTTIQFSAYYPGPNNMPGRPCLAPIVDKIPAPACTLQVTRQQFSNRCSYTLFADSEAGTLASYNFSGGTSRVLWNGLRPVTGQLTCSQIADSTFTAYVWGRNPSPQSGQCQTSVPKLPLPTCQLSVQRQVNSTVCDLILTGGGVIDSSRPPRFVPSASGKWTGTIWRGNGGCSQTQVPVFSATVFGPGGSQASCNNQ